MNVKLLTEHQLEFLRLKGGCTGSSESTHVKMPHCWKSCATAHIFFIGTKRPMQWVLVFSIGDVGSPAVMVDLLHG